MVKHQIEEEFEVDLDQPMTDLSDEDLDLIDPLITASTIRRNYYALPEPDELNFEWVKKDRYSGIFTDRDKEYLFPRREFEGQKKRDIRYRFRQRLAGLFDDSEAFRRIRSEDLESVFDSIGYPSPYFAHNLVLFAVRALRVAVAQEREFQEKDYEKCLETAIQKAESRYLNDLDEKALVPTQNDGYIAVSADVDVDLTNEQSAGDELREKILDGNASHEEFKRYCRLGSRRELVAAAQDRGMQEIEVRTEMGLTSRYDVEELTDEVHKSDDELTMREYLDILSQD